MKNLSAFLLIALLSAACLGSICIATSETRSVETSTTVNPWPMFRHDPQHTGYTSSRIPASIQQKWNFTTLGPGAVKTVPIVDNGMVFIGSNDTNFYALDQNTGSIEWFRTIGASTNHPAVDSSKESVFVGIGSTLYALNKTDGATVWTRTERTWYSPPTFNATSGNLFIGVLGPWPQYPYLFALDENDGSTVWSNTGGTYGGLPYPYVYTSPALSAGTVYVGSDEGHYAGSNFWASHQSNGTKMWQKGFSTIRSSPAVAWDRVFFGCDDGKLYALDATTGELIWSRTTGDKIRSSPAIDEAEGLVFIGSDDGKLYCLTKIGVDVWQHDFGQSVRSSPVVGDGKVLIAVSDTLYCLSEETGNEIWQYKTGGTVTSPAVVDETIFIGSSDGRVYALGGPTVETRMSFSLDPNPAIVGRFVTLLGNLTTTDGDQVPGELVTLSVNGESKGSLITNSTGWFKASGPVGSAGNFNITVEYAGSMQYLPSSEWEILVVNKAQTFISAVFVPNPVLTGESCMLKGILVDQFSNPIRFATVSLEYSTDYGSHWHPAGTLPTNKYGIFSKIFNAPSPSIYLVRITYAGSPNYESITAIEPLIVR